MVPMNIKVIIITGFFFEILYFSENKLSALKLKK